MKNVSLGLNVILTIAVIILYYFQFSSNSSSNDELEITSEVVENVDESNAEESEAGLTTDSRIGYINVDSLQIKYGLYDELKAKLKSKQKRYENEMASKSKAFQQKIENFRQKAPTMTQFEGELKQKELAEEEQALYKLEEQYSTKFQEELFKLNDELYKNIKDYIKNHNKDANFDIIIGESQTRNFVLDYNKGIDITDAMIEGLNEEYNKKNDKK
jgi:outer membrane protein